MGKLTKAQRRMLEAVADGEVRVYLEGCWGEYYWTERGKRLPGSGKMEFYPPLPLRRLLVDSLVRRDDNMTWLASGQQVAAYHLTPAGRRALAKGSSQ